jgi:hypothetical protein
MADQEGMMGRRAIEEKIVALAWRDDDFRQAFLADPKKQFEERLGTKLPKSLTITAWQEDADSLHFVIPAKPKADLAELSDADLEKVAGGVDAVIGSLVIAAAVVWTAGGGAISALVTMKEGGWRK